MPLTVRKVATAKPGRHSDGRGLMLLVKQSGARSWVLRYQMKGRRRDLGLGSWFGPPGKFLNQFTQYLSRLK